MTKERREELRERSDRYAREYESGRNVSAYLTVDAYELRALLDSDERLEAVRSYCEYERERSKDEVWRSEWIRAERGALGSVLNIVDPIPEAHNRIKTVANAENGEPGEGR